MGYQRGFGAYVGMESRKIVGAEVHVGVLVGKSAQYVLSAPFRGGLPCVALHHEQGCVVPFCHGGCNPCQEIVIDMPPPLGRHLGRGAAVGVPVENCDHRIVGIVGPASYIEAGYVARALSWRHPYRGFALWRGCEVRFGDVGWYACARACHFAGQRDERTACVAQAFHIVG